MPDQPVVAQSIKLWPIDKLIPYDRNARTHSPEQIRQVANSIQRFGFTNPILVASDAGIIAGHGRLAAARLIGMGQVPVIVLDHLTPDERRAYVIADNQLALNAGWDEELLRLEIGDLAELEFDLSLLGFDDEVLKELLDVDQEETQEQGDDAYSGKVDAPIYNPSDQKPEIAELYDRSTADRLVQAIKAQNFEDAMHDFLVAAAQRHTEFNYQKIADYYAQASPAQQAIFEELALVVIDFDSAIQKGFVRLQEETDASLAEDHPYA
jgi:ParB-like chromosome segregation protein Spo0J